MLYIDCLILDTDRFDSAKRQLSILYIYFVIFLNAFPTCMCLESKTIDQLPQSGALFFCNCQNFNPVIVSTRCAM